jgi:hypothetical protein
MAMPYPYRDLTPAPRDRWRWLDEQSTRDVAPDIQRWVSLVMPSTFEAYARVLPPFVRQSKETVEFISWRDLAERCGITFSPDIQQADFEARSNDVHPLDQLPLDQWRKLFAVVETYYPDEMCYCAVWSGYSLLNEIGRVHPEWAKVEAHGLSRNFFIFGGPVQALYRPDLGTEVLETEGFLRPDLVWSSNRTWLIASDIDVVSTYIGGPRALIQAIRETTGIETLAIESDSGLPGP